jgi:nicotinamidase-related amidase
LRGLAIDPARAALLVVDIQERLAAAMPGEPRAALERNVATLITMAQRLGLPVVASQQYPKGLGPTVASLESLLGGAHRFDKLEFSCAAAPAFEAIWAGVRRDQWIVTGMETHVCVYQSVRGLVERGAAVHVPADAVLSRTAENREIGLNLIEKAGGVITSTEVVVFDALGKAGTEDFKVLSKLIK